MWSSGFVGARLGTESAGTLSLLAWRFLLLVPFLTALIAVLRFVSRRPIGMCASLWRRQALVGLLSQVVFLGALFAAIEHGVSAGTAALVAALQPLLVGALAGPLLGEAVDRRQWAGLILGLCGVAIVVGGDLTAGTAPAWAYLLPFVSMLGLAAATLIEARHPARTPIVVGLSIQCTTSTVIFTAVALLFGDFSGPHLADFSFWVAIAWLVVFSGLGGYGLYWLTLHRTSATRVSSLIYLTPPTTALWAWAMFTDSIQPASLAGFAICAIGVAAVFRRQIPHAVTKGSRQK